MSKPMSLQDDPLIIQIKLFINDEIAKIANSLANGSAGSFDDYKKQCGRIQGLRQSLAIVDDAIELYVNDEDDDEI